MPTASIFALIDFSISDKILQEPDDAKMELYASINGKEVDPASFMVTTWADWKQPTIKDIKIADGDTLTIGVRMKCNVGAWGTVDDFTLNRISD